MHKVIAIMDRPENCQKCWFSACHYSLPLSTRRKGYSCRIKAEKVVEDFDYDAEVHLQNCPLKENYEQEIRNKAIGEFLSEICKKYTAEEAQGNYQHFCVKIKNDIAKIAESMKGEKEDAKSV